MKTRKNPKANLENKRGIFFQIGLVLALAAVFFAFEWKTFDAKNINFVTNRLLEAPDELPPITKPEPPPPPPAPETPPIFKPVDDKTKTNDTKLFNPEIKPNTPVPPYLPPPPPPEPPKGPNFFAVVEEMPSFPGGQGEMVKFLGKHIVYPTLAREIGLSGTVFLEFIVEKDGSISNIKVLRPIGGGCEEEAIRVVNLMPKWNPGKQRKKPVRVKLSLPVNFVLK
ncbi:MAG: energy transducer TonB [Bacteroidetes bacterium]|nr:energy transducer TonB [Bacteroidota bacterium]